MKLTLLLTLLLAFVSPAAAKVTTGDAVIREMYKKYEGKWYKTFTFVQKTVTIKPDGTRDEKTWYEAMSIPGRLRIDIDPLDKGDGVIFAGGKIYQFRDGKTPGGRDFVHPLLVLGFDVYHQSPETTISQVKGLGIDLSTVHEAKWQGRDHYVVGAKPGETNVPHFWVDKKDLYFTRLFQMTGRERKNLSETQFNKYYKVKGGGWVSPEVLFFTDGKPTMEEYYSDVQVDVPLADDLWNPEKWTTVDKSYFKVKKER